MKKFAVAELVELDVDMTAFGPNNNRVPDDQKQEVLDDNGNLIGWKAKFGQYSDN